MLIPYDGSLTQEEAEKQGLVQTTYGWMDPDTAVGLGYPATYLGTGGIVQTMGYNIDALNRIASTNSTNAFNADMAYKHAYDNVYSDIQQKLIDGPQVTPATLGLDTGELAKTAGDAGTGGTTGLQQLPEVDNPWYDFSVKDAVTGAKAGMLLGPVGALAGGVLYGLFGEEIKDKVDNKDNTNTDATTIKNEINTEYDRQIFQPINNMPVNYDFGYSNNLNTNDGSTNTMLDPEGVKNGLGIPNNILTPNTGGGGGGGNTIQPPGLTNNGGRVNRPDVRQRVNRRSLFYSGPQYDRADIYIPELIGS